MSLSYIDKEQITSKIEQIIYRNNISYGSCTVKMLLKEFKQELEGVEDSVIQEWHKEVSK